MRHSVPSFLPATFPCVLLMDLARYKYTLSVPRQRVLRILRSTIDINLGCVLVKATLVLIQMSVFLD